jgi:tRNA-2-methylthio-N6-dimethylallyladenosine synthase
VLQDIGKGQGVYISTYGCQMNVNDTERMLSLLEMSNYIPVDTPEKASLIIINACSVREKPVHKVVSELGRYKKLKLKNPNLKVGVGGCVGQQEKGNLLKIAPVLDFVFGTDQIDQLPNLVRDVIETNEKQVSARFENEKPYATETLIRNPGITAFVNIMKGCDNFCSFCIVPFTRGRERSRNMKEILTDLQALTKRGVKEVTLLGQNVNSYKSECGANFTDLLTAVVEQTDLRRIRYTSPHPKDYDQALIDLHQKYRHKICDFVHLPLQAGNSEVLEKMNRGYTQEDYFAKVKMIRDGIPGVALSTDIIVGFPGETEEQFQDTLKVVREVGFENIFPFAYSSRPFTKAAKFEGHLDEATKSRRLQELIDLQREISFEMAKQWDGAELEVLVEKYRPEDNHLVGRTTQNKLVHFLPQGDAEPTSYVGQFINVKVLKAFPVVLRAEMLGVAQA